MRSELLRIVVLLAIASLVGRAEAQFAPVDSIELLVRENRPDRASTLIDRVLSESNISRNERMRMLILKGTIEEHAGFIERARRSFRHVLAMESASSEALAAAWLGVASTSLGLGEYDSVLFFLGKAMPGEDTQQRVRRKLIEAKYWQNKNEHDKALALWQEALEGARAASLNTEEAHALSGIGSIFFSQEPDMSKALQHFQQAALRFDSIPDANHIARTYGRMANAYMVRGDGVNAERYLKRAKAIVDITGNLPAKSYIYSSFAILLAGNGDVPGAIAMSLEPAKIKRELGQRKELQNDLLNIAERYMYVGQLEQAEAALLEGIDIGRKLNDVVYLEYFFERMGKLDSLRGNYREAYAHLRQSMKYKERAVELQRVNAVEEIRGKYEAGQREKVIAEKELIIQQQRLEQVAIAGALAIVLLGSLVALLWARQKNRMKLQQEKEKHDALRLEAIVHTQEEVQQSIARDIHDGLVQVLAAAKVSLEAIGHDGHERKVIEQIRHASKIMDEACVEARAISHQLLPYSLMRDGLLPALQELLEKSMASFTLQIKGNARPLAGDTSIHIFRIVQECVNNIIKHAEATHVNAIFDFEKDRPVVTIADNGKGFVPSENDGGVGILNMQTRAQLINGTLTIDTAPGEGTTITLILP